METPGNSPVPGGDAQYVAPQALGEPGDRRFRIVVVIDGITWILWMEKQQVQALGMAMEQILDFMQQIADYRIRVEVDPALIRRNEIRSLYGSDARLRAVIGDYRRYSLEDTLAWMYAGGPAADPTRAAAVS